MPDTITLVLAPVEFLYLQRAVDRDRTDYECVLCLPDCDDEDAAEAARAMCMQRLLARIEQEQLVTH